MTGDKALEEKESRKPSPWSSLEITKIVIGVMTPVAIAALGFIVGANNASQAELNRTLDRRLELWDTVGPQVRQIRDATADIYQASDTRSKTETIGWRGVLKLIDSAEGMLEVRPFFTPNVTRNYLDFGDCALELGQATEFNADLQSRPREGAEPYTREHLKRLWVETERRYYVLIDQVRAELSTVTAAEPEMSHPRRVTEESDRDSSACLETTGPTDPGVNRDT